LKFMEIILALFRTAEYANTDLTQKLEPAFMFGLRCAFPAVREELFAVYKSPSFGDKIFDRFEYCFNESCQKWDTSDDSFWVKHCLDILLDGAAPARIASTADSPRILSLETIASASGVSNDSNAAPHLVLEGAKLSTAAIVRTLRFLCS